MQLQRCVFLCLLRFYFSGSSKSLWFINVCPEFRRLYLSATSSCVCLPLLQWFKLAKMIWSVINLPAVKSGVISVRVAQTRFHFCWLSSFSRCCCCFSPFGLGQNRCRPFCRLLFIMSQLLRLLLFYWRSSREAKTTTAATSSEISKMWDWWWWRPLGMTTN